MTSIDQAHLQQVHRRDQADAAFPEPPVLLCPKHGEASTLRAKLCRDCRALVRARHAMERYAAEVVIWANRNRYFDHAFLERLTPQQVAFGDLRNEIMHILNRYHGAEGGMGPLAVEIAGKLHVQYELLPRDGGAR